MKKKYESYSIVELLHLLLLMSGYHDIMNLLIEL